MSRWRHKHPSDPFPTFYRSESPDEEPHAAQEAADLGHDPQGTEAVRDAGRPGSPPQPDLSDGLRDHGESLGSTPRSWSDPAPAPSGEGSASYPGLTQLPWADHIISPGSTVYGPVSKGGAEGPSITAWGVVAILLAAVTFFVGLGLGLSLRCVS